MATLLSITRFLNKLLDIKKIPDSSKNGMQVCSCSEVKRIGFAVDACMEVFVKAKVEKCDMIIVHHGLLWKKSIVSKRQLGERIDYLLKNNISLYASHLPLDLHRKHGNNIHLANILGLKKVKKFGRYHKMHLGFEGIFEDNRKTEDIVKKINKHLHTKSRVMKFHERPIKRMGIVSGGGLHSIHEAIDKGLDCFLTGDANHMTHHYAKEAGINVISAGHYATETLGVKALMPVLEEKFDVDTVFIDAPTGL